MSNHTKFPPNFINIGYIKNQFQLGIDECLDKFPVALEEALDYYISGVVCSHCKVKKDTYEVTFTTADADDSYQYAFSLNKPDILKKPKKKVSKKAAKETK